MGKLLDDAICFAVKAHAGTMRKGSGVPYIMHPLEALAIAAGLTEDEEILAAAVLHDTLEDTEVSSGQILERFGSRVLEIVQEETEDKRRDMPAEDSWRIRKEEALKKMETATDAGFIVAIADKLSNMRAMQRDYEALGEALWQKFNNHDSAQHAWYYASLARIFENKAGLKGTQAQIEYTMRVKAVFGDLASL